MFAYANVQQALILSREVDPVNQTVVYSRRAISLASILEIHHENARPLDVASLNARAK